MKFGATSASGHSKIVNLACHVFVRAKNKGLAMLTFLGRNDSDWSIFCCWVTGLVGIHYKISEFCLRYYISFEIKYLTSRYIILKEENFPKKADMISLCEILSLGKFIFDTKKCINRGKRLIILF